MRQERPGWPTRITVGSSVLSIVTDTIADIDTQLVAVHWRCLHGSWADDGVALAEARAELDALLDRRYQLMQRLDSARAA
jgi:hypothetical protein